MADTLKFGKEIRKELGVTIREDFEIWGAREDSILIEDGALFQFSDPKNIFALLVPSKDNFQRTVDVEMTIEDAKKLGKVQYKSVLDNAYKVAFQVDTYEIDRLAEKYLKNPEKVKKWPRVFAYAHKWEKAPRAQEQLTAQKLEWGDWDQTGIYTLLFDAKTKFARIDNDMLSDSPKNGFITMPFRFILDGLTDFDEKEVKFHSNPDCDQFIFSIMIGNENYEMTFHKWSEIGRKISEFEMLDYTFEKRGDEAYALNAVIRIHLRTL